MVLGIVGIICSIIIWFFVLPDMLDAFALTTSIEMMKNRECINTVIMLQKFERAKRSFRIYQVLKLIRREMIMEFKREMRNDKQLIDNNEQLVKHVMESFLNCTNDEAKAGM